MEHQESLDQVEKLILALENLCDINVDKMSTKDYNTVSYVKSCTGRPSLESYKVSKEDISEAVIDGVTYLGKRIAAEFKDYFDKLETTFTFFEMQSNDVLKIKKQLSNVSKNEQRDVVVDGTKYFYYGDKKQVKNTNEFKKEFKKIHTVLSSVNSELCRFLENDFLRSWKNLVSPIIGYDKIYMEYFSSLRDLMVTLESKSRNESSSNKSEEVIHYETSTYLGMSHFEYKLPNPNSYKLEWPETCRKTHKHFWAALWREDKFELKLFTNKVDLGKTNKNDVEEILEVIEKTIASYREMLSLKNKLSFIFTGFNMMSAVKIGLMSIVKVMLSNYRIMVRSSWMLNYFVGNMLAYTRGSISSGLTFCKDFLKAHPDLKSRISTESIHLKKEGYSVLKF